MSHRRRSILIAESNRAMSQSLRNHLEGAGYSVFVAHDGEQAAILAARQRFDLIIADLELPAMTGTEFCRHVREDLRLTETPIVVCCPEAMQSEADRLVFAHKVPRVFSKPLDPAAVVQFTNETVRNHASAV
ncbi:PleD family two-component system response regulator [Schlesneria sp. T3-172]|uniref:response regulator n=1 Tax=Schlesneria sphaerica TaxID=3373610 RepID=UPI0037C7E50A